MMQQKLPLLLGSSMMALAAVAQAAPGDACVRYSLLIPDTGGIPLTFNLADGDAVNESVNLSYPASSEYTGVEPGSYDVTVSAFGTPVIVQAYTFPAEGSYTILFAGSSDDQLSSLDPRRAEARLIADDNTLAPPGSARVRFIHAALDAPQVDIATSTGVTLFDNIPYLGVSAYVTVDAGTYDLEVQDETGTTTLLNVPGVELASGGVYTVYAAGLVEANSLSAELVQDAPNDCSAQNYTGIWFDPAQPGQGIQLDQEGTALNGVFYTFDEQGEAQWYVFLGQIDGNSYSAPLQAVTGTPLGTPYNASDLAFNPATGTITMAFSEENGSIEVTAVIDGQTRQLTIVPF